MMCLEQSTPELTLDSDIASMIRAQDICLLGMHVSMGYVGQTIPCSL